MNLLRCEEPIYYCCNELVGNPHLKDCKMDEFTSQKMKAALKANKEKTAKTKRYIYVVALMPEQVMPNDETGGLSFRHAFVSASSDEEAYDAGYKMVILGPGEGRVNDYVVELSIWDTSNAR